MSAMRLAIILVILIGLGFLGMQISADTPNDDTIAVALDEATKTAITKGEFTAPEGITFVESKDCEGTQWIKQQECSLNGKTLDGTEGSCGLGKEIWILDPTHSDFKPATGDGKCEPQERECSVECPKPCEGDTWIDTGKCVRREYDTSGNMIETVLDGTEGKCGEGITQLNLDTNAPDYKPAVGTGSCPTSKGGYCNVPCPKPEPPKCNNYTGWVENTGLGCVVAENSQIKVSCGQKGKKMFYNIATNPKDCPELIKWEDCTAGPCPIDCVGSWSEWSAPKSDEPCGVQPYKERTFTITKQAAHGGNACDYPHGDTQRINSGTPKTCCEETGDWAMVGSCLVDGTAKYTQTYKENKPGGCPSSAKAKFLACCYQKGDWTDTTGCSSVGRKTQKQTTAGNCPESVKTRQVDCPYVGPWVKIGGCGTDGKQYYRRDVVNSGAATSKTENCCYQYPWSGWGSCNSSGYQSATRTVTSGCSGGDAATTKTQFCVEQSFETPWQVGGGPKQYGTGTGHNVSCHRNGGGALKSFRFNTSGSNVNNSFKCHMDAGKFRSTRGAQTPHGASGSKKSGRNAMWDVASHNVDCGNNFLTQWKLDQWSNSMRINYSCSNSVTPNAGACFYRSSVPIGGPQYVNSWAGTGDIACPDGTLITRWQYDGNKINYRCCPKP